MDYLSHYYRKDKQPFQSLSYLSDDQAERLGTALFKESPKVFIRFRESKFSTHWSRRRKTDQWVRSEFQKKGGTPIEPYPQYLVLGSSSYISALGEDDGYIELRIPLSELDSNEVSFTYSDCMVSKWLHEEKSHEEYYNPDIHGRVFTLTEILDVVNVHGIPNGEWYTDPKKAYDFFVEAQVWSFRPLEKYIKEHNNKGIE
jgi:hypothetical protein